MMIEVLFFGLSTNRGGIETELYNIWKYIDHSQYHFNYIDMTGEGSLPCYYDELMHDGCSFYKITPRNVSINKNKEDIRRLFQDNHFDIFHFNVNTLSYLFPVQEALLNGCKVIVHSRSSGIAANGKLTRFLHSINRIRLSHMNVCRIAVSSMAGDWLFGKSHYEVYMSGIPTEEFKFTEENRKKIREALGCCSKVVIANVGAFLPAKNHAFMVNVFEKFLVAQPEAVLWFIGDGPGRPNIEHLVQKKGLTNKILFLGRRTDMQELYAGMDLFWFPSLYEGFGNVLLEAECEGVPCLISDCIPQDALLADNTFSFSLGETRENWIKKMMQALAAQKVDRTVCYKELEEKGASVEAEIKRLDKLYKSVVGEGSLENREVCNFKSS